MQRNEKFTINEVLYLRWPFKCLFWNRNDSFIKFMVSITSSISLRYRSCYKNMLNYENDNNFRNLTKKSRFYSIVVQILVPVSVSNLVRDVKNLSSLIFKQIALVDNSHSDR